MALRNIPLTSSFDDLLHENAYTLGRLHSHPLATPLAAPFDAFQTSWTTTDGLRVGLVIAAGKAEGGVGAADDALDDFVDTLDHALLTATKNNRKDPLYQHYFGAKTPSTMKRPILGPELATVRNWIPSLQASPNAALAALASPLQTLVANADAAVTAKAAADQALKDFDTLGPKKGLVDSYNTLRADAYGKLAQLPHANPQASLPATFADRFFLHETRPSVAARHDAATIQAKLDTKKKEAAALEADLAAAKTTEQKHADDVKQAQQDAADLAQAKKDAAAAKQKVRDLEAKTQGAKAKAKKTKGHKKSKA
jgi:hypothetical protein